MNQTTSTTSIMLNSKAAHNATFRALHILRHDAHSTVTRIAMPTPRATATTLAATALVHQLELTWANQPNASTATIV